MTLELSLAPLPTQPTILDQCRDYQDRLALARRMKEWRPEQIVRQLIHIEEDAKAEGARQAIIALDGELNGKG
jgi:hypothetical protein